MSTQKELTGKVLQERETKEFFNRTTNITTTSGIRKTVESYKIVLPEVNYKNQVVQLKSSMRNSIARMAALFLWGGIKSSGNEGRIDSVKNKTKEPSFMRTASQTSSAVIFDNGDIQITNHSQCSSGRGRSFEEFYTFLNSNFKSVTTQDAMNILINLNTVFGHNTIYGSELASNIQPVINGRNVINITVLKPYCSYCSTISRIKISNGGGVNISFMFNKLFSLAEITEKSKAWVLLFEKVMQRKLTLKAALTSINEEGLKIKQNFNIETETDNEGNTLCKPLSVNHTVTNIIENEELLTKIENALFFNAGTHIRNVSESKYGSFYSWRTLIKIAKERKSRFKNKSLFVSNREIGYCFSEPVLTQTITETNEK